MEESNGKCKNYENGENGFNTWDQCYKLFEAHFTVWCNKREHVLQNLFQL